MEAGVMTADDTIFTVNHLCIGVVHEVHAGLARFLILGPPAVTVPDVSAIRRGEGKTAEVLAVDLNS